MIIQNIDNSILILTIIEIKLMQNIKINILYKKQLFQNCDMAENNCASRFPTY